MNVLISSAYCKKTLQPGLKNNPIMLKVEKWAPIRHCFFYYFERWAFLLEPKKELARKI